VFVDPDGQAGNAAVARVVTSLASRGIYPTWSRAGTLVPELGLGS
jgi:hypothetical protein